MAVERSSREKYFNGVLLTLILAGVGWNLTILSEIKSDMSKWIERTSKVEEKVCNLEKDKDKDEKKDEKRDNKIIYMDAYLRDNFTDYKPENDEEN